MFKPLLFISACIYSFSSVLATDEITLDTASMGAKYINDVYVDLETGAKKEVSRTNWDIAFTTSIRGAAILANNANNVEVMVYPKSTISGFHSVDTTGCYKWTRLYNAESNWDLGAFNVTTNDNSLMDYGWGAYNVTTHDVNGDSIFLVKTAKGMKKLVILRKISVENRIEFYHANLDNSDSTFVNLKANDYPNRNFVYYGLDSKEIVDREMDADKWDILFTKYMSYIPAGPGVFQWYPVVGVLINPKAVAAKYHSATLKKNTFEAYNSTDLNSTKNTIGSDWKVFDKNTFTYQVPDTNVYFIKSKTGNTHKFYFNYFGASSTGKAMFAHKLLLHVDLNDLKSRKLRIYPIPASTAITVETQVGKVNVSLYTIEGKKVYEAQEAGGIFTVEVNTLKTGIYLLKLESASGVEVKQISVNR